MAKKYNVQIPSLIVNFLLFLFALWFFLINFDLIDLNIFYCIIVQWDRAQVLIKT